MKLERHNTFKIKTIQLKKFNFEQVGVLQKQGSEIELSHKIGAIALKDDTYKYHIQLDVGIDVKQGAEKIFFINSTLIGTIEVGDDFEEELLNNMVAIMYSYLRPMVAQITVMAKLPPLDLPPANFENFIVKVIDKHTNS